MVSFIEYIMKKVKMNQLPMKANHLPSFRKKRLMMRFVDENWIKKAAIKLIKIVSPTYFHCMISANMLLLLIRYVHNAAIKTITVSTALDDIQKAALR